MREFQNGILDTIRLPSNPSIFSTLAGKNVPPDLKHSTHQSFFIPVGYAMFSWHLWGSLFHALLKLLFIKLRKTLTFGPTSAPGRILVLCTEPLSGPDVCNLATTEALIALKGAITSFLARVLESGRDSWFPINPVVRAQTTGRFPQSENLMHSVKCVCARKVHYDKVFLSHFLF